jgi:hypothetical protein
MNATNNPLARRHRIDSGVYAEGTGAWAIPPIQFNIDGETSVVARVASGRSLIVSAEGTAVRDEESRLWFGDVSLSYSLPDSFALRPLVGRRLRITLLHEEAPCGGVGQTLTVNGPDGHVWLLARHGEVRSVAHTIEGRELFAALSQRPDGPLVVGTRQLQWLVGTGERVNLGGHLVAHFVGRDGECAAYVFADESLCR